VSEVGKSCTDLLPDSTRPTKTLNKVF